MILKEIAEKLNFEEYSDENSSVDVKKAYTSDLLSDVMGNAEDESVLITIQAHKNTVAVASQLDSPAIIICNNRNIPDEMRDTAKSNGIGLYRTSMNQFQTSYEVYRLVHAL